MKNFFFSVTFVWFSGGLVYAQSAPDTVISLPEAKDRLVKKNLSLLAAYYDIDIAEARLIQARVWNNPYFIWNQELYNAEKNKYFQYKNQNLAQFEQIFSIAGKHTNTVKLAKIDLAISKVQFQDVLRSLLYDLGGTYNQLASLQAKELLYEFVISGYEKLILATREQLKVGAISGAQALRLESEYRAVKAQRVENANEQQKALAELRILLQMPSDTVFFVEQKIPPHVDTFVLDSLIHLASQVRPDLQVARLTQDYQKRNLKLQHSLSVPDVKLAYQPRDIGSNYVRPYSGFNIEFPLPLFDRNQGRIQEARFSVMQSDYAMQLQQTVVSNQVMAAYHRYDQLLEGLQSYEGDFLINLEEINNSIILNFQKRNISLLEFIDQTRIYITTNLQLIDLKQQYLDSVNDLNFSVGTEVVNQN